MPISFGTAYVATVTVLFFFWVYGIYAFIRDCRHRYLPAARRLVAARRARKREEREADDPDPETPEAPEGPRRELL